MFGVPLLFKTQGGYSESARNAQYNAGCELILTYEDTAHVRLKSNDASIDVILPNCQEAVTVDSTGFVTTFTGSASTFYYVYLTTGRELEFNTTAPDTIYTNQQTLSTDKVLVGYAGLSASNTMAGVWNVFSFYGQDALTWSTNITNCSTTYAVTTTMNGFVVPPNKTAAITRSGSTSVNVYCTSYWTMLGTQYDYNQSGSVSIGSWAAPSSNQSPYCTWDGSGAFSITKTHSDMSNGVFNISNIGLTVSGAAGSTYNGMAIHSPPGAMANYPGGGFCNYPTFTCVSATGAVTFTRQAS